MQDTLGTTTGQHQLTVGEIILTVGAVRTSLATETLAARATTTLAEESLATEGIYDFTAASGKTYVGQSGNIPARIQEHLASGLLLPEDLASLRTTEVLGGKTAREIAEQLRINELGGIQNLENVRNSIGPARQYLLK
jgi:hypothetical protein